MSSNGSELTGLIDLHAHILPGLDDGPETLEESLETAQAYVKAGYAAVVATPHVIPGVYENTRAKILRGVRALQEHLDRAGIPLTVLPGAEYHLTDRLTSLLEAGELVTLNDNGKYLLVELPFHEIPNHANQILFELMLAGITPVIAHPERNDRLVQQPVLLGRLTEKGVLAQVTAGSLTGLFGSAAKRTANYFINENIAQFMATDAHGPGRRLEAAPLAAKLLGAKGIALTREYPAKIVSGAAFEIAAFCEAAPARTGWLSSIFNRKKK